MPPCWNHEPFHSNHSPHAPFHAHGASLVLYLASAVLPVPFISITTPFRVDTVAHLLQMSTVGPSRGSYHCLLSFSPMVHMHYGSMTYRDRRAFSSRGSISNLLRVQVLSADPIIFQVCAPLPRKSPLRPRSMNLRDLHVCDPYLAPLDHGTCL